MTVGRIFARGLQSQGLHTFLIHLPGYGARRTPRADQPEQILNGMQQAVCDVRRARDAVACLPLIDSSVVGIQGTSLGGFITATTGGLDDGYGGVFILLAGGNLHDVVLQGKKDAAKVREKLEAIGVTGDKIRELARPWNRCEWPIGFVPKQHGCTVASTMMWFRRNVRSHWPKPHRCHQAITSSCPPIIIPASCFFLRSLPKLDRR